MTCTAAWAAAQGLFEMDDTTDKNLLNKKTTIIDILDRLIDVTTVNQSKEDDLYTIRIRIQAAFAIMQAVDENSLEVVRTLETYIDDNINKHILGEHLMSLPTEFQRFIHLSRYARWIEDETRRETWEETVKRYFDFFEASLKETCDYTLDAATRNELEAAVLNLEIMPSMRALMAAGPALARENIAGYNCAFVGIDRPRVF